MVRSPQRQLQRISRVIHSSNMSWIWRQSLQSHLLELMSHTTKFQHRLLHLNPRLLQIQYLLSLSSMFLSSLLSKLQHHKILNQHHLGPHSSLLLLGKLKLPQLPTLDQIMIGCNIYHLNTSNMWTRDQLKALDLQLSSVQTKQFVFWQLKSKEKLPSRWFSSSLGLLPQVSACFTSITRWLKPMWSQSARSKACK